MSSKEIVSLVADPHLLSEVEQCAAVLGFSLIDGLMDAALASRWRSADAVVADCGGLDEVSSLSLPPRRGMFVVCAGTPPWERGVQVGAEDVMVLPARSGDLVEALSTRCSRGAVSGGCIAVVSAVGGAGGSTVAAGLALSWARSGRGSVVVDANCVSGADDVLLGVESEPGMRWGDVSVRGWENGGVDGRAVAANIPATPEGVGVLSVGRGTPTAVEWNQRGALVQRVAGSLAREGLSVVVDVSGAMWWEASGFTGCDCVFVVVPATLRGLGGAVRWSRAARQGGADPVAVVKHEAVSSVGAKDVESVTSMPVVAEFTSEKKIAKEIEESGLRLCGRSSFARMVSGLREIADGYIKNSMPSLPVDECAMSSAQSRAASMGGASSMSRVRSFVQACHSGTDNSTAHTDDASAPAVTQAQAGGPAQAGAVSDRIRMRLAQGNGDTSTSAIAAAVRAEYPGIGMSGVVQEVRRIREEIHGAGPVEPLLDLPDVTDVLVNGASEVWVDGPAGLCRVDSPFRDDDHVRATAVRLAAACGHRLDDASPYADGFYRRDSAGGSVRVHAVLPPVVEYPCLSLRVLGTASTSLDDLVRSGSVPPEMADELRSLVRSRQAFVVSGGTGAGKTTLLSALLAEVSPDERIVCVEDTRELHPRHPHVVALTTTSPNVEGQGEITLRNVVKQTLRMRPDRIVVGEIRGAEIQELFAALNTGHDGGCGTIHANGPEEIPARCEALGAMAGMSPESVRTQFRAAIRVVVHVERASSRRLASVGVVPSVGMNSSLTDGKGNDEQPLYPGISSSGVVMVWTADGGRTDAWPLWERVVRGGAR